jgi:beta-phosphoglucomutase-like phosphatase (HAD superfamily)
MQIIQKSEQYTDQEIDSAINEEIRKSLKDELDTQQEREILMRAHAASMKKHKTIPGLGKCVAVMPAREFFRLQAKYGAATVHSKEFIQYFNQKFPEMSPNNA